MTSRRHLTGLVCDDRPDVRRTVAGLLKRCGFDVVGEADSFSLLRDLVRSTQPTVVVLSLPVVGMSSLAAVHALHDEAPACDLVILSAFQQLHLAALEAGARALVPEDDPQALQAILLEIAAESLDSAPMTAPPPAPPRTHVVPYPRTGSGSSAP